MEPASLVEATEHLYVILGEKRGFEVARFPDGTCIERMGAENVQSVMRDVDAIMAIRKHDEREMLQSIQHFPLMASYDLPSEHQDPSTVPIPDAVHRQLKRKAHIAAKNQPYTR